MQEQPLSSSSPAAEGLAGFPEAPAELPPEPDFPPVLVLPALPALDPLLPPVPVPAEPPSFAPALPPVFAPPLPPVFAPPLPPVPASGSGVEPSVSLMVLLMGQPGLVPEPA